MKCTIEMGSDAMIYKPGFIKTGLSIQKLTEGGGGGESEAHNHTENKLIS
jgi:hypothetical protein